MPHMRVTLSILQAVSLALLVSGCGALQRPSRLRPPPHPLLEAVPFPQTSPRSRLSARRPAAAKPTRAPEPVAREPERRPQRSPARPVGEGRAVDIGALRALEGRRTLDGDPASDEGLLRTAYGAGVASDPTRVGQPLGSTEPPRPGDVVLFVGEGFGPRAGVLVGVEPDGLLEVMFVTRGAVRTIVADRRAPHTRRRGQRVRNSFIRPVRKGERHDNRLLAGQLLAGFRRLPN